MTTASFVASDNDSVTTFGQAGTSSFSVAAGLTIIGNIHATGKLTADGGVEFGNVLKFEGGPSIGPIQSTNVYKQGGTSTNIITTSTDLLLSSNAGVVFDLLPFSEVNYAGPAIKIIDSQNDGYAGPGSTGTNITLNVGRIYHNFGALVIESDGSLFLNDEPQYTLDGYGQLILKNLDGSAGIVLGGPMDDYFNGGNTGTVAITAGGTNYWTFGTDGELTLPNGGHLGPVGKGWTGLDGGNGQPVSLLSYYTSGDYSGCVSIYPGSGVSISTYGDGTGLGGQWTFGTDSTLTFPDTSVQTTAFSTASYISKADLKAAVAASNSWTDFQSFIAAL